MKGLLYKEWATLTSSYKQSVFFIAFLYGGISILTGRPEWPMHCSLYFPF